ncbi:MAG TPA: excinuclease ABC subunit C [Legionellales bacterium]|nr:excinuclease ABC subunit C [Legionellales bacterium]
MKPTSDLSSEIQNTLKYLTEQPGVYRMKDEHGDVIYIGKATNLKKRVRSYFVKEHDSPKTKALVQQIHSIEITITRSEKEALLLECTLIKNLQPKYNILMRDDKSFPYLFIQQEHAYPKMLVQRLKNTPEKGLYFGPYPNAGSVYATINLLQTIFKLRNCSDQEFARRSRPCLQYQIKRCSAPCVQLISAKDYQQSVNDTERFLQGKAQDIFAQFQLKMDVAVERLAFEEAAIWRDKIKNLRMVQEQQAMICIQGELDIIAIAIAQGFAGLIRVSVREGKVIASDVFFPKIPNMNWYESTQRIWQEIFSDFISYYYSEHQMQIPKLILTTQAVEDSEMLMSFLGSCHIQVPKRGQKKDWLDFAIQNLEQAIKNYQVSWSTIQERYQALSEFLGIAEIQRMECFDISHTQGQQTVASCVVFDHQGPSKKDYRRFNIEGITPGDDYAAMRQVLLRRSKFYLQEPQLRPQLVLIDGGVGQVNVAVEVLKDLILEGMLVLGVSKGPTRKAGMEKIILVHRDEECSLPRDSKALHLIQHIRDEAHRFAITLHRAKRQKKVLESSLDTVPGIGHVRRRQLLKSFGGIRELSRASIDEIAKVPGISYDLATRIFKHFHPE